MKKLAVTGCQLPFKKFSLILLFSCALMHFCPGAFCKEYPQRIISLGAGITRELYLLGVEDRLIANTIYCRMPPEAEKKEKIGGVVEVNIEKIVSLKPDLILATSLTEPKAIQKLKKLGIKVITFSAPESFSEICEQFLELGKIVGREKEAEEIIYRVKKAVFSVRQKVKKLPRPKVLVQVGARPLWVATKDSLINDFIEFAGGKNIGPERSGIYSREKVLEENPDVIIITTMGIVGENEKKLWQKYKAINAVKNNRVYIIDSYKLCSPTPASFVETLKEIAGILHFNLRK